MKKLFLLLLLITPVYGVDYNIPSQTLASSADALALGTGLFSDNPTSVFDFDINQNTDFSVGGFQATLMDDYTYRAFAISKKINSISYQIGYSEAGTDDIDLTTTTGFDNEHISIGSYAYKNQHIKLAGSKIVNNTHVGVGLNYYSTEIHTTSGSGFNVSTSALLKGSNFDIAVAIQNLLTTKVEYDNGDEELPLIGVVALRIPYKKSFYFYPQIKFTGSDNEYDRTLLSSIGVAYTPIKQIDLNMAVSEHYAGMSVANSIRVGMNLNLKGLLFSYAFRTVDYSQSSEQHFFSIAINK